MTRFNPLYDRIVVRRENAETMYKGLIHFPEQAQSKPQIATVVSVGQGHFDDLHGFRRLVVKPGDKVLFGKYTGTEIRLNDEELVIMREDDILGIVTD